MNYYLRYVERDEADQLTPEMQKEINDATVLKNQILQDAEAFAHEQIDQAMQECAALREQTGIRNHELVGKKRAEDEELHQRYLSNQDLKKGYRTRDCSSGRCIETRIR